MSESDDSDFDPLAPAELEPVRIGWDGGGPAAFRPDPELLADADGTDLPEALRPDPELLADGPDLGASGADPELAAEAHSPVEDAPSEGAEPNDRSSDAVPKEAALDVVPKEAAPPASSAVPSPDGLDDEFAKLDRPSDGPDLIDCGRCGTLIDPAVAAISGDGPICKRCESREQIRDAHAVGGMTGGWTPLNYGLLSLICNPLFIPSLLAVSSGYTVLSTTDALEAKQNRALSSQRTEAWMGIIFGLVHPVFTAGAVALVLFMGVIGALNQPDYDPYAYDPYAYDDGYNDYGGGGYDDYGGGGMVDDLYGGGGGLDDDGDATLEELMRQIEEAERAQGNDPYSEPAAQRSIARTDTYSASVALSGGDRTFEGPCSVVVETLSGDPSFTCRVIIECDGTTVYGAGTSGYNLCRMNDGRPRSARDVSRTPIDGDPALTLDLDSNTVRVSDPDFNLSLAIN